MNGSVRKLKSGSWELRYELPKGADGKRQLRSKTVQVKTQGEAKKQLRDILTKIDTGLYIEPTKQTVGEYLEDWLTRIKGKVTSKTHEGYAMLVRNQIAPRLGEIKLDKLKPTEILDFQNDLLESGRVDGKGGLSPRRVLHVHRCLSTALKAAVAWEILPRNPCDRVDEPKVEDRDMDPLSVEETARLLRAAEGTNIWLQTLVAAGTSMRRGEILGLQWRDLDLEKGRATVRHSLEQIVGSINFKRPKNGRIRVIELPAFVIEALVRHKGEQAAHRLQYGPGYQDLGLVFAREDGTPLRPDRFSAAFGEFIQKNNLPHVRFHDLRHSSISQLLDSGMSISTVQRRAGHTQASTTVNLYGHRMRGADQAAAQHMDDTIGKALRAVGEG
jgi:integrase